jgi:hypothetical protein
MVQNQFNTDNWIREFVACEDVQLAGDLLLFAKGAENGNLIYISAKVLSDTYDNLRERIEAAEYLDDQLSIGLGFTLMILNQAYDIYKLNFES